MYKYNCNLVKVVDGDTVDVDIDLGFGVWLKNQRIRLAGIDAPESRTRDLVEKQFGLLAKSIVETLLSGDFTLVSKEFSEGKYGRILGDFEFTGMDLTLCEYLLENNYAAPYEGQSKDDILAIHLKNREILINEGRIKISS